MVRGAGDSTDQAFGFLTVCDAAGAGTFGGYLLVDHAGRPLEFHCTAPVRVTRAQEILYGATLQRQLHGEQIGGPLLKASTIAPVAVLTDRDSLLYARPHAASPLAVVCATDEEPAAPPVDRFRLGSVVVRPHRDDASRADLLRDQLGALAEGIELTEPFARIREALEEAQRHS